MAHRPYLITNIQEISKYITLTESEKNALLGNPSPPFSVTEYYAGLMEATLDCPIRRQCIPTTAEKSVCTYEFSDPLFEKNYKPAPRLVHRYPNRVLLLASQRCAVYCRHCFRRYFTDSNIQGISDSDLSQAVKYIKKDPRIQEVLISGGDPLMLHEAKLKTILTAIGKARDDIIIRIGTRVPVVFPSRVKEMINTLTSAPRPVWIVTQFNHPKEITPESSEAIDLLIKNSIPVLNQSVLLQDINDSVSTLAELCQGLVSIKVKPYYIFQGDLAAGTSHFRVPIQKTLRLQQQLRREVSGIAMPEFAVDLPDGGGKIPLTHGFIQKIRENEIVCRSQEGIEYTYPNEGENK
ncbi:MAG: KamA family radical SAM protein [Spirochaetia bacterium]